VTARWLQITHCRSPFNTPAVVIQQAAEKPELLLPIQDLDLHEISELPSEGLHVLVELSSL
jgi:hypothetical protein